MAATNTRRDAGPVRRLAIWDGAHPAGLASTQGGPPKNGCGEPESLASIMGTVAVIQSPAARDLFARVQRVAQSTAAVLITGESGSGKELIARAIHQFSPRCNRPWVDINCAALPDHLVESELFGYEKGAFSGAECSKQGMFELAHSGTLLLDEIGDLDLRMQAKLLRVLDGSPYYRLGSVRKCQVDVRLVAATNQDLEEAVRQRKFRADLYHRLNQIHLHVPSLRERPEDVAALARHFLRCCDPRLQFSVEALELLRKHDWPGNVRELRNVVTAAAIFAEELYIQPAHFPPEIGRAESDASRPMKLRLDGVEQEVIFQALAQTGGRQDKAAALLGISRRTLIRKLKLYRSDREATAELMRPQLVQG